MKKAILIIAVLILTASLPLWADLIIEESMTNAAGSSPEQATIYVAPDRLAVQQGSGGIIFLNDKQILWQYDTSKSVYMEFTPEAMKNLKAKSDALLAQEMDAIKQQMQSLPPDQKEAMQKALDQMQAKEQYTFKRLGPDKTVNGWRCTPVQVLKNGEVQTELCVAPLSELGISPNDVKVFGALDKFYSNLQGNAGGGVFGYPGMDQFLGFHGFPIQETAPDSTGGVSSVVKSVKHAPIPARIFTLPPDLSKTDLFGGQ